MWDPCVSVGVVKTKIHPHSWLLLSLDLPSASDICLGLYGTSTQCSRNCHRKITRHFWIPVSSRSAHSDPAISHILVLFQKDSFMRVEWPLCFGLQTKLRYLCSTALGNVDVLFTFHSQWGEIGASQRQCTLSAFMLISRWVESPSQRLSFSLGPPGHFQSLGKLIPFERKGNDVQKIIHCLEWVGVELSVIRCSANSKWEKMVIGQEHSRDL